MGKRDLDSKSKTIRRNYIALMNFFGSDPNPIIESRLGTKLIDRLGSDDNYLWMTGEIENKENVTVYNVILNFTLYAYRGIDDARIAIDTMEP